MEKHQKRIEGLEIELVDSMAARSLAESNDAHSSKVVKVAEAKVAAALSRLTTCEMELEVLRSKLSEKEVEM